MDARQSLSRGNFGTMTSADKPNSALDEFVAVQVLATPDSGDSTQEWSSQSIFRWSGHVIESWRGPSSEGPRAPDAVQLKEGTSEIGYLDLGTRSGSLSHKTGTVLGELISFEQSGPGLLPSQRTIEVRLAIRQLLRLDRKWGKVRLNREDGTVVAVFSGDVLKIRVDASRSEGTAAVLIATSGVSAYLRPRFLGLG
jgi:hypothetical protein